MIFNLTGQTITHISNIIIS